MLFKKEDNGSRYCISRTADSDFQLKGCCSRWAPLRSPTDMRGFFYTGPFKTISDVRTHPKRPSANFGNIGIRGHSFQFGRNCVRSGDSSCYYYYRYAQIKNLFYSSIHRLPTGRWAFFSLPYSIHSSLILKPLKSSYLVWTHFPISVQNIVIPRH